MSNGNAVKFGGECHEQLGEAGAHVRRIVVRTILAAYWNATGDLIDYDNIEELTSKESGMRWRSRSSR